VNLFFFIWNSPCYILPENSTYFWYYFRGWLPRVHQESGNFPAQQFWRKVITMFTGNKFEFVEDKNWQGTVIQFEVDKGEI